MQYFGRTLIRKNSVIMICKFHRQIRPSFGCYHVVKDKTMCKNTKCSFKSSILIKQLSVPHIIWSRYLVLQRGARFSPLDPSVGLHLLKYWNHVFFTALVPTCHVARAPPFTTSYTLGQSILHRPVLFASRCDPRLLRKRPGSGAASVRILIFPYILTPSRFPC